MVTMAMLATTLFIHLAQSAEAKTDEIFRREITAKHVVGAVAAVLQNGKLVFSKAYGLADEEKNVKMSIENELKLGSVTKQFTATLVMKLVESGDVELNRSVRDYLPSLPKTWQGITVYHLLTHTSGIPNYTDNYSFAKVMRQPGTDMKAVQLVGEKLDFVPGSKWHYSNTGYVVLGLLIEKIMKMPYASALKLRIFDPLKMTRTGTLADREKGPQMARGYARPGQRSVDIDAGWPGAAGNLVSTVGDLLKWVKAQRNPSLLKESSWQTMVKPARLNDGTTAPYGFGWALGSANGTKVVGHGGSIPGFESVINQYPDKHLAVIVLANADSVPADFIARQIAQVYEPSLVEKSVKIEDKDAKRTDFDKKLLKDVLANKLGGYTFVGELKKLLTAEATESVAQSLKTLGALKGMDLVSENISAAGDKVRQYVVHFQLGDLVYFVGIDAKGGITTLAFRPS